MKRLLLVVVPLVLSACATPAPPPEPVVRTVEVKVPFEVRCRVPLVPERSYAFEAADIKQPIDDKVKFLLADRLQRVAVEGELRTALARCTEKITFGRH